MNPMDLFKRTFRRNQPIADRTRPGWAPEAFRARCLELLETHHIAWAYCRLVAHAYSPAGRLAWVEIAVPVTAFASAVYLVRYDVVSDSARCDCTHAQHGQPCVHAGAAIAYGRRAAHAERARGASNPVS